MLSLKHICFISQVVGFYRCSFDKIVAMNHTSALQELALPRFSGVRLLCLGL